MALCQRRRVQARRKTASALLPSCRDVRSAPTKSYLGPAIASKRHFTEITQQGKATSLNSECPSYQERSGVGGLGGRGSTPPLPPHKTKATGPRRASYLGAHGAERSIWGGHEGEVVVPTIRIQVWWTCTGWWRWRQWRGLRPRKTRMVYAPSLYFVFDGEWRCLE